MMASDPDVYPSGVFTKPIHRLCMLNPSGNELGNLGIPYL